MSSNPRSFILASASPRRLNLLKNINIIPSAVCAAQIDETPLKKEHPRDLAHRLSITKATEISGSHPDSFVLGADTVVAAGRRILGKTEDADEARGFLELLSGRRHKVYGGITITAPQGRQSTRVCETVVQFKKLNAQDIESYLASEEWRGKAGAYAIQGRAGAFVKFLSGSYSNVVGLSLYDTMQMLTGLGFKTGG